MTKPLSEMISEIEPYDSRNGMCDEASYERMKQIAIELSQTIEALFNSTSHPTTVIFIGDSLSRAKEIIGVSDGS